jgi:hypothetical protein
MKIDIDNYPAIKVHLLSFGFDRLKQTGEPGARKRTNNKWFETQDSISYWDDFSKPKIVWGEISDKTKFCIDLNGEFVTEATTFLMIGENLLYLLGYLNSKLSEYLFSKIGTTTGVGTLRWKKFTIEQLRVPAICIERYELYANLVKKIINQEGENVNSNTLLNELNSLIYEDIGLTDAEIDFIESH